MVEGQRHTKPFVIMMVAAGLLLSGFSEALFARWVDLGASRPMSVTLDVVQSNREKTVLRFSLHGYDVRQRTISGKPFGEITVPGLSMTDRKGFPELPRLSKNILIPYASAARLRIVDMKSVVHNLGVPVPSKGTIERDTIPNTVPYTFAPLYVQGQQFPEATVVMGQPFQMRNTRGVTVNFFPFQFDASNGLTTVFQEVTIEIDTPTLSLRDNRVFRSQQFNASFLNIYKQRFANFSAFTTADRAIDPEHFVREARRLLVITHGDFVDAMAPYVAWKRQTGFDVKLVTLAETGATAADIKEFIQNEYDLNQLAYVLLVGDAEYVPFHKGSAGNASGNEADPMYGLTEGDDDYPDVFISRFSVKSESDAENMVARTVNYEKFPSIEDADWYSKAVGIASNEGNPTDKERAEILRETLEEWHYTSGDKFYDPGAKASKLTEALNEGRGFINYIGHGSKTAWVTSGFNNSHIDALENGNRLPFIVSVACVNGDFGSGSDTFGERWLKAGSAADPKGAIAVYASSTNQSWVPPTVGQREIVNLLTGEKANTIGGLFVNGVVAVLEDNSSSAAQTFETWHIFGDASLQVRTQKPSMISTDLPANLYIGAESLRLEVGEPGIRVGVVQDGQLIGSGTSNKLGELVVSYTKELDKSGEALITLTGFNKIPRIATVPIVVPVKFKVVPESIDIDDAMAGTTVRVTFLNGDDSPATGVRVWFEGFGFRGPSAITDQSGKVALDLQYAYGPSIQLKAKRDNDDFYLLNAPYAITGAATIHADLQLTTPVKLSGAFAVGFSGAITADFANATTKMLLLSGTSVVAQSDGATLVYTPEKEGTYTAVLLARGHNVREHEFKAIHAEGELKVTVLDGDEQNLTGVKIGVVAKSNGDSVDGLTSNGSVAFEKLSVGRYALQAEKFGYLIRAKDVMLNYGANAIEIQLEMAPQFVISGTVMIDGEVTTGVVKVYKDGELAPYKVIETSTDGAYELALPAYNYDISFNARGGKREVKSLSLSKDLAVDVNLMKSKGILLLGRGSSPATIFEPLLNETGEEVIAQKFGDTDPETWFDYTAVVVVNGKSTAKLGLEIELVKFVAEGGKLFISGGELGYTYKTNQTVLKNLLLAKRFGHEKSKLITFPEKSPIKIDTPITIKATWGASDTFVPAEGVSVIASTKKYADEAVVMTNGNVLVMSLDAAQLSNDSGERDALLRAIIKLWH